MNQYGQSYGGNAAYGSSDPGYGYGAPPQQPYGGYGAPYQQIVDPSQALTGGRQIGKAPSARKNKKNTIGKAKAKAKEAWTELDQNVRIGISVAMMLVGVLFLRMVIVDPDILFFIAEGIHAFGVAMLLWKIHRKQSVGGISLGMQLLTAIFIGSRFMCALFLEASWSNFFEPNNLHGLFDGLCLMSTIWVIYQMVGPMKHTYEANKGLDSLNIILLLVPCGVLAALVHPPGTAFGVVRTLWAFSSYVEAVSILPQIYMFQKARVVERFAGHYVFCLAIARYLCIAHWLICLFEGRNDIHAALAMGIWMWFNLLSETVHTFITADFVFLYVQSYAAGLPSVRIGEGFV